MVENWVECPLPVWTVINTEYAKQHGPSFAIHFLKGQNGDADLQLFTSEEKANRYIAEFPLPGHEPHRINDAADLRITLEVFKKRNGTHVRIDDPNGRTPGLFCPTLDEFLTLFPPQS